MSQLTMAIALLGCSGKSGDSSSSPLETQFITRNDDAFPPVTNQCETAYPPVLMAHGFLAAGDTYDELALRLVANGHCPDLIFTYDWNTFSQSGGLAELEKAIDTIIEQTGVTEIDLMGHSAGGGLGLNAITSDWGPSKIRRYVHIGASPSSSDLTVPTLNLYSLADTVVQGGEMPSAFNVVLTDADHFEVATREDAFEAIFEFLYDSPPIRTDIQTENQLEIWGKALSFGENNPMSGTEMFWYRLEPNTGLRLSDVPEFVQTIGDNGLFGPIPAPAGERYEILLDADIPIRHYYLPFTASHRHLRLRAVPEEGLAATLLSGIPFENDDVVKLVSFSKQQAMIAGRDTLSINGRELLDERRAAPENTLIALFHYDNASDGIEGEDPIQFNSFPFIRAVDQVLISDPTSSFKLQLNGRHLHIPYWGEGAIIGFL